MFKYVKDTISKAAKSRMVILVVLFLILAFILVYRLFTLQIVEGESYLNDFTMQIEKERTLKSTRGIITDRNGKLLAYNKLAHSVTFEDTGAYDNLTRHEKNLALNGSMYGILKILEKNGDKVTDNFGITLNSAGEYQFVSSGTSLLRFKADIYGQAYIENLTEKQTNRTAAQMMEDLCDEEMYGVLSKDNTKEELAKYGLPETFTKEETLSIVTMRSKIAANSFQKYLAATLATNISDSSMSTIMESKDIYPGVDVVDDTIRVYDNSIYFAPIIGYTGQISSEELNELNKDSDVYNQNDIVGKIGLEQVYEDQLQGLKGSERVYVNNLGKILKKDNRVEPQAGNNIQLTLDTDYQIAAYRILEQYIAGIVYTMLIDAKEVNIEDYATTDDIKIPVYDVYYALFENNVLDVNHISSADASTTEKQVYQQFLNEQSNVFAAIKSELTADSPAAYKDLGKDMQAYMTYVVNNMLMEGTGILQKDAIDKSDETYLAWTNDGSISLQEYLTYAISKNWVDISKIPVDTEYLDSKEVYSALSDYIAEYLSTDTHFSKKIYRYMIESDTLSATAVCLMLFDQGVIKMNQEDYNSLASGSLTAFDFIHAKIYSLELTPAQLALDPCSGSLVINNPNTGEVLACVTYPSYDNNRLANDMDSEYYAKLATDLSSPFYNKATQEITAPGSTYKMVTAAAGVTEGVIGIYDTINCTGKFDLVEPPIRCWISPGAHGPESLSSAIKDSCNFYFNSIGYMLGDIGAEDGKAVDEVGIEKLAKYAEMFGFDAPTGIEIGETDPHISDNGMAPSAMGQGTNAFTTSQLSRYVATIANGGTCYDLTLLDKISDSDNRVLEEKKPKVHNNVELDSELWSAIHTGMNEMVKSNNILKNIKTDMAGKTGTAQETGVPSHALFVGYAPYDNPEIAIAVRITNGYTSTNAASVAGDMVNYIFKNKEADEIIPGHAIQVDANTQRFD
ncbi:penicillin-binding transpeptidase domain-containing protein [uncultured Robinsoniella sp.]|uniref:penicillin-binding transpeptidase domain-containing protein n=1 Tax=uncultured Robinsoniella sp. TaxID=904190 RepID=UPI00374F45B6